MYLPNETKNLTCLQASFRLFTDKATETETIQYCSTKDSNRGSLLDCLLIYIIYSLVMFPEKQWETSTPYTAGMPVGILLCVS